ncbi:DUF6300 family protein [Streptomyces sp. NPDC048155]|uniref:DUF6300 family protein n=1 Tax=Streptomyces sp. NPDC048155 TaxID=3154818 RepID=UPI0033F95F4B
MTPRTDAPAEIELRTSGTPPPCPHCEAPVPVARYSRAWRNRAGEWPDGLKETVLCRSCDINDPAAGDSPPPARDKGDHGRPGEGPRTGCLWAFATPPAAPSAMSTA